LQRPGFVTSTLRAWLAGGTLLAAAVGVAVLAGATRLVAGAADHPSPKDLPLGAAGRRAAGLADDGRPVLLIVLDPSCGACEEAKADLAADPSFGLGSAGVAIATLPRARLADAELCLPPGFFPAYLLFDGEGRPIAHRRGYGSPETIRRWTRAVLLDAPTSSAETRPAAIYMHRRFPGP
jgi:hypothetical protein